MLQGIPNRLNFQGVINRRGAISVSNGGGAQIVAGPFTVPANDEHDIGEMAVGVEKGAQLTRVQLQYLPANSPAGTAFTTVWGILVGDYGQSGFGLDVPRIFFAGDQYQVVASAQTGGYTDVALGGFAKLKDARD